MDADSRRHIPLEALIWTAGLIALYLIDPASPGKPDLCLVHRLGLGSCPGCGLGAAIHHLLHGRLSGSWMSHPLGIPALAVLLLRIYNLVRETTRAYLRKVPNWCAGPTR